MKDSLTIRQFEVAYRIALGMTNKQVAGDMGLSEKTVKAHATAIYKLYSVANRTQFAIKFDREAKSDPPLRAIAEPPHLVCWRCNKLIAPGPYMSDVRGASHQECTE